MLFGFVDVLDCFLLFVVGVCRVLHTFAIIATILGQK